MQTAKSTVKKQAQGTMKDRQGEASMKPLTLIYWSRVALGVIAALICVSLNILIPEMGFFTGVSLSMLFYILTYYIYKPYFITKVEKPTKVFTTGIGAYFITWIVTWILFYTVWLWYANLA